MKFPKRYITSKSIHGSQRYLQFNDKKTCEIDQNPISHVFWHSIVDTSGLFFDARTGKESTNEIRDRNKIERQRIWNLSFFCLSLSLFVTIVILYLSLPLNFISVSNFFLAPSMQDSVWLQSLNLRSGSVLGP
jgi:hypothetical protein